MLRFSSCSTGLFAKANGKKSSVAVVSNTCQFKVALATNCRPMSVYLEVRL